MASTARLDELKKKFDENPRRYFAPLANEHRKSGDLDQAISLCRTHLPQQPAHISGHIVLAQALFEAGSLDESREIFHTALGLDPENLIALRYLGDIAKESSDLETARTWYQRVLEVDPRNDEIVQLVRDLDAPRPIAPESVSEHAAEPISTFAPSIEPPEAPVLADNDARFAPLSMDQIDLDEVPSSSSADDPAGADNFTSPQPFDHAAWNSDAQTAEMSSLETPGIDPFDLDPAGSADSLLDAGASPTNDDFFLTELSGSGVTDESSESEPSYAAESSVPQASSEPAAEQPTGDDGATFEEGSFYLEPPPPAPVESSQTEDAIGQEVGLDQALTQASSKPTESTSDRDAEDGMDAFAAEYYAAAEDPYQSAEPITGSYRSVPEPEPNAQTIASFADAQTAEWQPPVTDIAPPESAPVASDSLGLEVMEFVPPTSQTVSPPTDADVGRTPEIVSEQASTPEAFVTETMAELYLQQGFRNEALAVYRVLLARNPADASLRERIDQIESGSMSSLGMATLSESVVESALKRQTARPARSVRSFFASLAGRRAPVAPQREIEVAELAATEPAATEPAAVIQPVATNEHAATETVATESVAAPAETAAPPRPDRVTPLMSAAETLATFDPFADAAEPTVSAPAETPNAAIEPTPSGSANGVAEPAPIATYTPTTDASPATPVDPPSARRSLEDLFPSTPITPRTDAAAQTLATAFGRSEPQGRPTRAASNELSLDHVFRGAPEGAPATDGGFSFDQFFSDSRTSSGDVAASTASAHESSRSGGSGDANDIEQFTAWLEGLKKK